MKMTALCAVALSKPLSQLGAAVCSRIAGWSCGTSSKCRNKNAELPGVVGVRSITRRSIVKWTARHAYAYAVHTKSHMPGSPDLVEGKF